MSEHHWHVKEVLKHLCKAGLYAKVEKCEFHSKLIEYLEYILSPSGLTMFNNKVKIIQDWPESKKVKNIQSFLFIFNYLDIVIPLAHLTWKNILWKFSTPSIIMLSTPLRRHSPLLLFSLIGFPILNSM